MLNCGRSTIFLLFLFLLFGKGGSGQGSYRSLKAASKNPKEVFELNLVQTRPKAKHWELFRELENLNELYIEDLLLDTLPASMSGLYRMSVFRSQRTPISHFPDTLKNWSSLKYLELVQAELDSFPAICTYWRNLREIGINENRSEELVLPPEIGALKELRLLAINASPLAPLPDELSRLRSLKKLIITDCGVEKLPPEIGQWSELEVLVLDNGQLEEIPRSIGSLRKLEYLSLRNNLLEALPESISGLRSLRRLDIRGNYFSEYQLDIIKALLPDTEILHDPVEEEDG